MSGRKIGVFARRYIMASAPSWMERHIREGRGSFRVRREAEDAHDWRIRCMGFKIRSRPGETDNLLKI